MKFLILFLLLTLNLSSCKLESSLISSSPDEVVLNFNHNFFVDLDIEKAKKYIWDKQWKAFDYSDSKFASNLKTDKDFFEIYKFAVSNANFKIESVELKEDTADVKLSLSTLSYSSIERNPKYYFFFRMLKEKMKAGSSVEQALISMTPKGKNYKDLFFARETRDYKLKKYAGIWKITNQYASAGIGTNYYSKNYPSRDFVEFLKNQNSLDQTFSELDNLNVKDAIYYQVAKEFKDQNLATKISDCMSKIDPDILYKDFLIKYDKNFRDSKLIACRDE